MSAEDIMGNIANLGIAISENIRLKKQALINFILEDADASVRLRNIKFYLLKEQVTNT